MINIPKRYAAEVIEWLDQHVSANRPFDMPDSERTASSRLNPYHVSATAHIATWQGERDLWRVRQSARLPDIEVSCHDLTIETFIKLKWSAPAPADEIDLDSDVF